VREGAGIGVLIEAMRIVEGATEAPLPLLAAE
jgi:hypothetical protein